MNAEPPVARFHWEHQPRRPSYARRYPTEMKRFSMRQTVIYMPFVAAIVFAWYSVNARQTRLRVSTDFDRSVERNDALFLEMTAQVLGKDETKRRIMNASKTNANIVYDGGVRFAQLLPNCHDNGHGSTDGYNLSGLGSSLGPIIRSGPTGTRITSMAFDGDELIITLFGDLKVGSFEITIPEDTPDVYAVPWPANSPFPPSHDIHALIRRRHANSMVRAAGNHRLQRSP